MELVSCDYLIKRIWEEELNNIWQDVVRKNWIEERPKLFSHQQTSQIKPISFVVDKKRLKL